jgi:hypothetical protein
MEPMKKFRLTPESAAGAFPPNRGDPNCVTSRAAREIFNMSSTVIADRMDEEKGPVSQLELAVEAVRAENLEIHAADATLREAFAAFEALIGRRIDYWNERISEAPTRRTGRRGKGYTDVPFGLMAEFAKVRIELLRDLAMVLDEKGEVIDLEELST